MNDWLRLVAYVIIGSIYIASTLGNTFEKHYAVGFITRRPPLAKYKIIDDSK